MTHRELGGSPEEASQQTAKREEMNEEHRVKLTSAAETEPSRAVGI